MKNVSQCQIGVLLCDLNQSLELTSLSTICPIFIVGKVLKTSDLVKVIFDVLNDARRTIFNEVIHCVKRLEDALPLLWLALHFFPQMLHDNIVVFPVVCVVSKHL